MGDRMGLEAPATGAINWQHLSGIVSNVARSRHVPGDLASLWKERLKSEATHVVLNTLTALHTLSLNGERQVRDQIALSKCMKHLDRLLNKPPFPGVEMAAAQLLIDWAFLYGAEELGLKSFQTLTSTSKHRAMLQNMQASDVAIMLREDQKIGMPQFVQVMRGLDFGKQYAASQYGSPLTGASVPPGVLSFLAKAAVAASYSSSSSGQTAAEAAASRNTFAAWAQRVQQDPQGAAERVLSSQQMVEADIQALAAAQAACLAAARPFLNKPSQPNRSSSSSSRDRGADEYADLRSELDKAYLMACKCTEWREMIQVLLQHQLPDSQISALLQLADAVNGILEEWQAAATTEIFWLLGVDTAGLADGSSLKKVLVQANLAPAAAAAAAAGATGSSSAQPQQQQQQRAIATRASYLDLLTGDALPTCSSDHVSNPFYNNITVSQPNNPFTAASTATAAAAAGGGGGLQPIPPELQSYLQETTGSAQLGATTAAAAAAAVNDLNISGAAATAPAAAATAPAAAAAGLYPAVSAQGHSAAAGASSATISAAAGRYPEIPPPAVPPMLQQQQQPTVQSHWHSTPAQQQQQQQRQATVLQSLQSSSSSLTGSDRQRSAATALLPHDGSSSTGSSSNNKAPVSHIDQTTSLKAAAAAAVRQSSNSPRAAAAAAGDTGSSQDSVGGGYSYINPFAALDTNKIITGLRLTSPRTSVDDAAAAAAAAAKQPVRSSSTGAAVPAAIAAASQQQQDWQQQQLTLLKKREPPPPPPPSSTAAAAAGDDGSSKQPVVGLSQQDSQSQQLSQQQQQQRRIVGDGLNLQLSQDIGVSAAELPPSPRLQPPLLSQQQLQQQPLLNPREVEQLQHKLQAVLDSCRRNLNTNSSSSSSECVSCGLPPAVALQSPLLQLLVQQEQQHRQQQQQVEQQHRQEVKRVKEMALEKLREMQQQLVQAQQQIVKLQQQQQ